MFWSKNEPPSEVPVLTPAAAPVSEMLILICEKCGKKLSQEPERNPAREIQLALKEEIKSQGGKGKRKAVLTSCMDLCPEGEIAVTVSSTEGANRFYTLKGLHQGAADLILKEAKEQK